MQILISSPYLSVLLVSVIGLLLGSFNTMAVYRLPREMDVIFQRSHCTNCRRHLTVRDLIPVFSWLISGGKCRHCHHPIAARYPMIEVITVLFFVAIYWVVGWQWSLLIPLWVLASALIVMTAVDFEFQIIPDSIHVVLIPTALYYRHVNAQEFQEALWGGLAGFLVAFALRYGFWLWKKKEGLGLGDVKFFVVVGVFIQPELFPVFMFMSGMIGIVTAMIWKILGKGEAFPFGPALGFSMFLCVLFPEHLNILGV